MITKFEKFQKIKVMKRIKKIFILKLTTNKITTFTRKYYELVFFSKMQILF
jgi:hypothetical protein